MAWYVRVFRNFWLISPFRIAIFAFCAGLVPFLLAGQFSAIGNVTYYMPIEPGTVCDQGAIEARKCLAKQVGYIHALNWWPPLLLMFPFALFFAFESIQNTRKVVDRMVENGMFVSLDWTAPIQDITPVINKLWRTFFFIGLPAFLLVALMMIRDWWCVVHWPLSLGVPLGDVIGFVSQENLVPEGLLDRLRASNCYSNTNQENDWSVSATFEAVSGLAPLVPGSAKPGWWFNYIFSAYNYALLAIWAGVLFAYFGFVLALTMVVNDLNEGRFGFQLTLNLNSSDTRKRRGFENLESIFKPCIYVTIICFSMAFLMRIQNVYLRNEEYGNIFKFLFTDIPDAITKLFEIDISNLFSWFTDLLTSLQKFFDFGQFSDPQSLLGAPAIMIMLGLVSAALAHILRKAAIDSQGRVLTALNKPAVEPYVLAYYQLSKEEAVACASDVEAWPLSWPELQYAVRMMGMGVFCYIFYRVAFLWIGVVAARSIQGRWSEK